MSTILARPVFQPPAPEARPGMATCDGCGERFEAWRLVHVSPRFPAPGAYCRECLARRDAFLAVQAAESSARST